MIIDVLKDNYQRCSYRSYVLCHRQRRSATLRDDNQLSSL